MMKRGGRGHDPKGIGGTAQGELAVKCPTCPRPLVNLPEGFRSVAPSDRYRIFLHSFHCLRLKQYFRWLYRLHLAMDANFRLKNRLRSSIRKDPGLLTGLAYFVDDEMYSKHILKYVDEEEVCVLPINIPLTTFTSPLTNYTECFPVLICTCAGFEALAKANTRNSKGLRSTGVGACICSRHSFWRGQSLGDLQKGER